MNPDPLLEISIISYPQQSFFSALYMCACITTLIFCLQRTLLPESTGTDEELIPKLDFCLEKIDSLCCKYVIVSMKGEAHVYIYTSIYDSYTIYDSYIVLIVSFPGQDVYLWLWSYVYSHSLKDEMFKTDELSKLTYVALH